jgi:thiol-disulfide isomerase/thioredoxin
MALTTLEPNPAWASGAHQDTVDILGTHEDLVYKIWGGDWCPDCRSQLPDFAAALDAAEIPDDHIEQYELDKNKNGPGVEAYDIDRIPTVVIEHDGDELARFVESEPVPIAVYLAQRIEDERSE